MVERFPKVLASEEKVTNKAFVVANFTAAPQRQ